MMWITAARATGQDGTELRMREDNCEGVAGTVVISDPSRIMLFLGRKMTPPLVCIDEGRARQRWNFLCSLLRKASRRDTELVLLINANGKLGGAPAPRAEQEVRPEVGRNGERLLKLTIELESCAPAEFERALLITWVGRDGCSHEIDLVFVHVAQLERNVGMCHSGIEEEVRATAVEFRLWSRDFTKVTVPSFYLWDTFLFKRCVSDFVCECTDPSSVLRHQRCDRRWMSLPAVCTRVFAPGPRKPWFSERSWQMLQQLVAARPTRFKERREQRRNLTRFSFHGRRTHHGEGDFLFFSLRPHSKLDWRSAHASHIGSHGTEGLVSVRAVRCCEERGYRLSEGASRAWTPPVMDRACDVLDPATTARLKHDMSSGLDGIVPTNKAALGDAVANDLVKLAGSRFCTMSTDLFLIARQKGVPCDWTGGPMVANPKQPRPMSKDKVRGTLRSSVSVTLFLEVLANQGASAEHERVILKAGGFPHMTIASFAIQIKERYDLCFAVPGHAGGLLPHTPRTRFA